MSTTITRPISGRTGSALTETLLDLRALAMAAGAMLDPDLNKEAIRVLNSLADRAWDAAEQVGGAG